MSGTENPQMVVVYGSQGVPHQFFVLNYPASRIPTVTHPPPAAAGHLSRCCAPLGAVLAIHETSPAMLITGKGYSNPPREDRNLFV